MFEYTIAILMRCLLFTCTLFIFISCKKDVASRLEGKWDYIGDEYYIQSSVFVTDSTKKEIRASITFIEGGTGTFSENGKKNAISWSATDSEVTLGIVGKDTLTYQVISNEKDIQKWSYIKEDCNTENIVSPCYKWENQLQLEKVD